MVTALGGCAVASDLVASIKTPAATEIGLAVFDGGNKGSDDTEVSAAGALSAGEGKHV